jgi:hypothetical protein
MIDQPTGRGSCDDGRPAFLRSTSSTWYFTDNYNIKNPFLKRFPFDPFCRRFLHSIFLSLDERAVPEAPLMGPMFLRQDRSHHGRNKYAKYVAY